MDTNLCGLYGIITKNEQFLTESQMGTRNRIISSLALAMESRGNESTGIATIGKNSQIFKKAINAGKFIQSKEYQGLLQTNPKIIIGHTRQMTIGAINDQNAHPFKIGKIIGAHNGSVVNYFQVYPKADVDSQAIFFELNKQKNNFKEAFSHLRGKMAVSWVDEETPGNIYLVRHKAPLSMSFVPEIRSYVWCSLSQALELILYSILGNLNYKTIDLEEDMVYKLKSNLKIKRNFVQFGEIVVTENKIPVNNNYSYKNSVGIDYIKQGNYYWEWGFTPFFFVPSLKEQRVAALLKGCGECGKEIALNEGFNYHEETDVVLHDIACTKAYTDKLWDLYEERIFVLFFSVLDHKEIIEKITSEAVDNTENEEPKSLAVI